MPYEFKLDGGRDRAEGILQVKAPNTTEWSNFCVSDFSTLEAAVVCQTLGYKYVPSIQGTDKTFIFDPSVNLLFRNFNSISFQFDNASFAVKLLN